MFTTIGICCRHPSQVEKQEIFTHTEKMLLATDIVLATLTIVVATLMILQAKGVVNLGDLSVLGSLGTCPGYYMILGSCGVLGIDFTKWACQLQGYLKKQAAETIR
ncbi:MAG: hypothetical protein K940chlam9_01195 [Chlamydiae bacterium]|nr:hypothetical protein [Chlamydiota bacterium]